MSESCTARCWTPVPCPECGSDLPPRGRDVGSRHINACCEGPWHESHNPRHLWSEHDSTRHYTDPEGWAAHVSGCAECREDEES